MIFLVLWWGERHEFVIGISYPLPHFSHQQHHCGAEVWQHSQVRVALDITQGKNSHSTISSRVLGSLTLSEWRDGVPYTGVEASVLLLSLEGGSSCVAMSVEHTTPPTSRELKNCIHSVPQTAHSKMWIWTFTHGLPLDGSCTSSFLQRSQPSSRSGPLRGHWWSHRVGPLS